MFLLKAARTVLNLVVLPIIAAHNEFQSSDENKRFQRVI